MPPSIPNGFNNSPIVSGYTGSQGKRTPMIQLPLLGSSRFGSNSRSSSNAAAASSSSGKSLLDRLSSIIYTSDSASGDRDLYGGDDYSSNSGNAYSNAKRQSANAYRYSMHSSSDFVKDSGSGSRRSSSSKLSWLSWDACKFVGMCVAWYMSSAIANNIGKHILTEFRYPVSLTYGQFFFVAFYCILYGKVLGFAKLEKPTRENLSKTVPLAGFLIVGHVFNSVAISNAPVSFVHTVKAASPLFTVLMYRMLFGTKYPQTVYTALVPLTTGVMLACFKTKKDKKDADLVWGSVCALISCLVYVSQNIFSKKYLFADTNDTPLEAKKHRKMDKINVLLYSSVMSIIAMLPVWYLSEGKHLIEEGIFHNLDTSAIVSAGSSDPNAVDHHARPMRLLWLLWLNGTTYFGQNVLAVSVLSISTAVTYSIASLLKRVFVIVAAFIWFWQPVGFVQGVGVVLAFIGLYLYDKAKGDIKRGEKESLHKDVLPIGGRYSAMASNGTGMNGAVYPRKKF
ncbi:TPT-domain-containing protein [Ramicandelaber brevisporus]|nr:TPT-domain-containing protein [Ramicandelaber brevisporus]